MNWDPVESPLPALGANVHIFRRLDDIKALVLQAADDELGKIRDVYCDCDNWLIRYVAINEGLLQWHRVHLIPAMALDQMDQEDRELFVQLTRDEVLGSPAMDERSVLDRHIERQIFDYYGWPVYWEHEHGSGIDPSYSDAPLVTPASYDEGQALSKYSVLCRLSQVEGYMLRSDGATLGHVTNAVIDTNRWRVAYLEVRAGEEKGRNRRLIDAQDIQYVDWAGKQIVAEPDAPRQTDR